MASELIWFLIGFGFLISEFFLTGFISVFFGLGAWVTSFLIWALHLSLNAQLVSFLMASILSLLLLRKKLANIFSGTSSGKIPPGNHLDDFIGQSAKVVQTIHPQEPGRISFRGTEWIAESDQEIFVGSMVQITKQNNLTLTVKPKGE